MNNSKIKEGIMTREQASFFQSILQSFGIQKEAVVKPYGSGLINHTWKVSVEGQEYILQKVNHHVFSNPGDISDNIRLIADHLSRHAPGYLFVDPIPAANGADLVQVDGEGYFRLFPFVRDSYTIDVVENTEQAYEAAVQFGRFTRLLCGFEVNKLKVTIPDFHNLSLRYRQFLDALQGGNRERVAAAQHWVQLLVDASGIVSEYEAICKDHRFRKRVTHHDAKISNVLFDQQDRGLCIIDPDTIMPGYFISDVGDMMRTYLCPVSEEESDLSKICIRDEFYKAIVQGYLSEMKDELTDLEKESFFYAGKFMIYMQALRYMTDHVNGDTYYGARYEGQNLVRAKNQIVLLQELVKKEKLLSVVA